MVFSLAAWAGYLQVTGNYHVVEPGLVYRSNTLSQTQLRQVIERDRIRTILNLRGAARGQQWYDDEAAATQELGVTLIDLPLNDGQIPGDDQLAQLIEVLRTASRPLLIHCRAGADRTGLAAALFEFLVAGRSANDAAGQLSFAYGHFPWLGSRTIAMDAAFWNVVADTDSRIQAP